MSATLSTYARCSSLPQRAQAYKRRSLRDLVALRAAAHGGYARAIQRVCGDSHVQRARRKHTFIRPHAHTKKKNGPFLNSLIGWPEELTHRAVDDHCDVGNSKTNVSQQVLSAYLLRCMGVL